MKFKQIRKAGAVLLAAAVVCGALPVSVGGTPLFDTAITASAASDGGSTVDYEFQAYEYEDFGCFFNDLPDPFFKDFNVEAKPGAVILNGQNLCSYYDPSGTTDAYIEYKGITQEEFYRDLYFTSADGSVHIAYEPCIWYTGPEPILIVNFHNEEYLSEAGCWTYTLKRDQDYGNPTDWLTIKAPTGRELDVPDGLKIVSGAGTESSPFQLELYYAHDPLPAFETVSVGKKWYTGDFVNTNAYFTTGGASVFQLMRKKLVPAEHTYNVHLEVTGFEQMCAAGALRFSGFLNTVGLEVVSGSGTQNDPFQLAPIIADENVKAVTIGVDEYLDPNIFKKAFYGVYLYAADCITIPDYEKFDYSRNGVANGFDSELLPGLRLYPGDPFPPAGYESLLSGEDQLFELSTHYSLRVPAVISFDANGGTGEMASIANEGSVNIVLPECTFTAPENMEFEGWEFNGFILQPGQKIPVESTEVSVKAIWKDIVSLAITKQPAAQTASIGENAVFKVEAEGSDLNYQWQFLSSTGWQDSGMTGAKTNTLSVPVTAARDGQQYRCVVSDPTGYSVTSDAAAIIAKPIISTQPKNYTGNVGDTAKFTVTADGKNLTYQWQFLSNTGWQNSGMTGAQTATLSVPVTEARNGQQYRCIVKSSNGTSVTSGAAKIVVAATAPVISAQPKDYSGAVGETAKFTVTATGTNLSYQWQFLDNGFWKSSGMTGAKTASLSVPITAARNGQQYRCIVSFDGTSIFTNAAKIIVKENPITISAQPKDYTGAVGETAKFTVNATGTNLTYQWQFKSTSGWQNSGMTGSKTNTLSVPVTEARNGQQYRCVISSNGTSVNSNPAKIIVKANAVTISAQPKSYTGNVGDTAKFTVAASGTNLTYQWQYLDKADNKWKNSGLTGALTNTLTVPVTAARDGLQFHCIVKSANGASVTSGTAQLTVKPAITANPKNYEGKVGDTAKFTVTASGTNLTYQWQFLDNGAWKNSGMTGAKTSTLSVPVTAARDGQKYRCVVTAGNGSSSESAAAAVLVKPVITANPSNFTGKVGDTAKFTVTASGTGLTYQWQFYDNGVWKDSGMTGAKTATISVPVTAARNGQQYRCVVKAANGATAASAAAKLTVKS